MIGAVEGGAFALQTRLELLQRRGRGTLVIRRDQGRVRRLLRAPHVDVEPDLRAHPSHVLVRHADIPKDVVEGLVQLLLKLIRAAEGGEPRCDAEEVDLLAGGRVEVGRHDDVGARGDLVQDHLAAASKEHESGRAGGAGQHEHRGERDAGDLEPAATPRRRGLAPFGHLRHRDRQGALRRTREAPAGLGSGVEAPGVARLRVRRWAGHVVGGGLVAHGALSFRRGSAAPRYRPGRSPSVVAIGSLREEPRVRPRAPRGGACMPPAGQAAARPRSRGREEPP